MEKFKFQFLFGPCLSFGLLVFIAFSSPAQSTYAVEKTRSGVEIYQYHDYVKSGKSEVVKAYLLNKKSKDAISPNWWNALEKRDKLKKEEVTLAKLPDYKNWNILYTSLNGVFVGVHNQDDTWSLLKFNVVGEHSSAYIYPNNEDYLSGTTIRPYAFYNSDQDLTREIETMIYGANMGISPGYIYETLLTANQLKRMLTEEGFVLVNRAQNYVTQEVGIGNYEVKAKAGHDYIMMLYTPDEQPITPIAVISAGGKSAADISFFQEYQLPGALSTLPTKVSNAVHQSQSGAHFFIDVVSALGTKYALLDIFERKKP
ncbi:hypothetical protein SAMN04488104_100846 [Algoriphagus faecimaris]|uniref:Uncharacterized protein n=1 Tax=Algoriphagus faecimaris TaxID=686796 RepID=A0A1G6Q6Q9_9BACT|nr:hypothetical protein [Algoriphagus faecimaris]SDC87406.1 hypothetical protein SAMN04488104_100846 [Algoriphagus faecimaris]